MPDRGLAGAGWREGRPPSRSTGVSVSHCHHGLDHQKSLVMARVKHRARKLLCRCPGGGHREIGLTRDNGRGPRTSVHRVRPDHANRCARANLDFWTGPVLGKHHHRTLVALAQNMKPTTCRISQTVLQPSTSSTRGCTSTIASVHTALGKAAPGEAYGASNELRKAA